MVESNTSGKLKALSLVALAEMGMNRLDGSIFEPLPMGENILIEPKKITGPLVEQPRLPVSTHTHFIRQRHTSGRRRF